MLSQAAPWIAGLEAGAQWIAPGATMIAAMMTAANLGARVTGWGFAIFSVGAIAWVIVALASGQHNLLLSNAFLLIVDLVGVWRWLGRRARYDKGAERAESAIAVRSLASRVTRPERSGLSQPQALTKRPRSAAIAAAIAWAMSTGRSGLTSRASRTSACDPCRSIMRARLKSAMVA